MYSSEDLERFYFQYKTEALPLGYRDNNRTAEEIKELRNDSYTEGIVNSIDSGMYDLLVLDEKNTSPLLRRALNNLHKF